MSFFLNLIKLNRELIDIIGNKSIKTLVKLARYPNLLFIMIIREFRIWLKTMPPEIEEVIREMVVCKLCETPADRELNQCETFSDILRIDPYDIDYDYLIELKFLREEIEKEWTIKELIEVLEIGHVEQLLEEIDNGALEWRIPRRIRTILDNIIENSKSNMELITNAVDLYLHNLTAKLEACTFNSNP